MKKCLVLKEMEESNNNARFKNLRIKLRLAQTKYPFIGTICTFDNFHKREIY